MGWSENMTPSQLNKIVYYCIISTGVTACRKDGSNAKLPAGGWTHV